MLPVVLKTALLTALTLVGMTCMPAFADDDVIIDSLAIDGLSSLPAKSKLTLSGLPGEIKSYRFSYHGARCVLLVVPEHSRYALLPGLIDKTAPTSTIAATVKALIAVNGGYFNLSDGESASYATIGGKQILDPRANKALTGNKKLEPFLPAIFNRSELRVYLTPSGKYQYTIERHDSPVPPRLKLVHALQGGPRLLPALTGADEAFVRTEADGKQVDSIGVNRTAARTAIALGAHGERMVISCAGKGQDEFSSGLTLPDLATLLKNLGAVDALNFDGGTSTTLVVSKTGDKIRSATDYEMLIGRNPETRVRSILYVGKAAVVE